jgi:hypothetical protein
MSNNGRLPELGGLISCDAQGNSRIVTLPVQRDEHLRPHERLMARDMDSLTGGAAAVQIQLYFRK